MRPQLGHAYTDIVIDKTGYVTAVTDYMNGCVRVTLEGLDFVVDGKTTERFVDAQQLLIDKSRPPLIIGALKSTPSGSEGQIETGGPCSHETSSHEASRAAPKKW